MVASSAPPVDNTSVPNTEPVAEIAASANPRDWTLIAAGIGGGVLLGALGWLVIWLASPEEVAVAATSAPTASTPAQVVALRESPAAVAMTPAPTEDPPAPEAPPQPAATDALVTESPAASNPDAGTPVSDVPPAVAPDAAPDAEQPSAAADARPELKLDPVAPQLAEPTDADPATDSLGEAVAADEAPSDNSEPAADDNLSAVDETSPGEPAPLPVEEIQSRLSVPLARVDFSAVPLGHLAAFLSDVSGARVVIDEPSMARSGKSRKTPVTIKLSGSTALAMLEAAAEQAGLDYRIEPGRITLTARGP